MTGETNLSTLLSSMEPELIDGEFVFCTLKNAKYGCHAELQPLASYQEQEGLTLLLNKNKADQGHLKYDSVFSCITLTVHSSLDAVGLTAAVATSLADEGISANVVAAFYHDHIFVQVDKAKSAIQALNQLSAKHQRKRVG